MQALVDGGEVEVRSLGAGAREIRLNAPARRNALSPSLIEALCEALTAADQDPEIRVVVLRGSEGNFCAGGDLSAMGRGEPMAPAVAKLTACARGVQTPTIAVMEGAAVGAGLDLAMACDLRLASSSIKLSTGFARVGLVPAEGGAWLLTRLVGEARALELIWSARLVSAEEALRLGIVNSVASDEAELETMVESMVKLLATGPQPATRLIKELVRAAGHQSFEEAQKLALTAGAEAAASEDHAEGVRARLEKRSPVFAAAAG